MASAMRLCGLRSTRLVALAFRPVSKHWALRRSGVGANGPFAAVVRKHSIPSAAVCFSSEADEQHRLLVLRKKMRHQARTREDALLANFLSAFVEAHGEELAAEDLEAWQRLMECDDELIMNWAAKKEEPPEAFDTELLKRLRHHLSTTKPPDPFGALG
eukprot:TRINITY_DN18701_c0_g1_i1.p1 TRINITY_DN18701_c0_g1~~TRINITY_DN18701_c0_g1_i1.p1  ORF type:complete len:159 (+),score=34.11 TRINITY_DN18701_c0_g1_i1:70-546(+)